ncbi:RNA polymerase II-associated protein 1, partial [Stegodyphus mimosarum]
MYSAMKLMRIISATSQGLALHLVENYGLISNITFYLTLQPLDGKLSPQEVQMLMVETLKTWCILLCYGLATKVFLDLFPIFLKQLDFCESLNLNSDKSIQDFEYAVHLFKAFEAIAAVSVEIKDVSGVAINAVLKKSLR